METINIDWQITKSEQQKFKDLMLEFQVTEDSSSENILSVEYNRSAITLKNEKFTCDFNDSWHQNILYSIKYENSPLAKAINTRAHRNILDATAGWGRDAYSLCALGANVFAVEQHPIVALMLAWSAREMSNLTIACGNNQDFLDKMQWDVIYFDFMFEKNNRKSKSNPGIEFLAKIVGPSIIPDTFWQKALHHSKRIVIKRPRKFAHLNIGKPNHTINAKTVCFDVYLGE